MGDVVNTNQNVEALKVLIQQVLDGTIDLAESIGFIIQSAKRAIDAGDTTWNELGTTEEQLKNRKGEARQ
jgi:hypothetical protein